MSAWSVQDRQFMSRAIQLAKEGLYTTHPNPRVGCVLVKDGTVVGEGFHLRAGEGHAEVNALAEAGGNAKGATAYVTLEPCSHHGRTPPCAEGLIKAGVERVVAAMVDPNPQVAGRGLKMLQAEGIKTASGLLEHEARALNPGFIKRMESGLPYVRLKLATSLDGRTAMASGESQWITGPAARSEVQRLRARSSAIISGIGSILQDDSSLTLRENELGLVNASEVVKQQPLRVVLDTELKISAQANVLKQPGRCLIVTTSDDQQKIDNLKKAGAELLQQAEAAEKIDLSWLLSWLAEYEQCNEVLVETGATLAGAFVQAELVDEIVLFMAMTLMGSDARPAYHLPLSKMADQIRMERIDSRMVGDDLLLQLKPCYGDSN